MKLPRFLLLPLLSVPLFALADEGPARLDMTGLVTNAAGDPVSGVTVYILAAGPRKGSSPLCPYNYEDCGKRTLSDAEGQFRLPSLNPTMDFCITAVAPGYETYVNSGLLPEAGPVKVKMRPRDLSKLPADRQVSGRIIDHEGNPVVGALIDVGGVVVGTSTHWGGNNFTEIRTITDAQGEFHLGGRKDFDAVHVTVDAPGLADRWAVLEKGKNALLRMKAGSSLKGRLLWNGQPLAGVALAASSEERECGKYFNVPRVTTDAEGRFVFAHLPPGMKFRVFALMSSMRECGGAFAQSFVSGLDGAAIDLGDVQATPAYRFSGQVILTDGKPLPPNTRLMLDRTETTDTSLTMLDEQGHFEFAAVPAERVSVYLTLNGYRWSEKNPSIDRERMADITGRMTADQTNFKIVFEPGKPPEPNWDNLDRTPWEELQKKRNLPLRSAP